MFDDIDLEIAKLAPEFDKNKGKEYLELAKLRCLQDSKKHLDGDYGDVIDDASLAIAAGNAEAKLVRAYAYYLTGSTKRQKTLAKSISILTRIINVCWQAHTKFWATFV
ncbi:MAG: hypothetical protein LBR16_06120 [Treponema sp.]|nr:hypothetical protein [Treponema sp.]